MEAAASHMKTATAWMEAADATTAAAKMKAARHRRDIRHEAERTHGNAGRQNCYRSFHGRFSIIHRAARQRRAGTCLMLFIYQLLSPIAGF